MKVRNRLFSPYSPSFRHDSALLEDEARSLGCVIERVAPAIFCADDVVFFCSDAVSVGAALTANHKLWVKGRLEAAGVPVPPGGAFTSPGDVPEVGFPVVVKPLDSTGARGVTVDVRDRRTVVAAAKKALKHADAFIVEKHVPGDKYRLLTLDDEVIAAFRSEPGPGQVASVHAGGRRVEAMAEVTGDMRQVAVSALAAVPGLHLAGVDVIAGPNGPRVLEVNATPRIWGHHHPDVGEPVNVAADIAGYYLLT